MQLPAKSGTIQHDLNHRNTESRKHMRERSVVERSLAFDMGWMVVHQAASHEILWKYLVGV